MRRRKKYDLYIVIFLAIFTVGYFVYNQTLAESHGIEYYSEALEIYKSGDFEKAYKVFAKVPSASSLKSSALFRQARCATNQDKKELAIKKYNRIVRTGSKSSIAPISEYNMASLMFDIQDKDAKKHFKKIIKKFPSSDYAIASEYYLGMIELANPPKSEKRLAKSKERALIHFRTYIEKSPDGRFAINSIDEINKLEPKLTNYDNLMIAKAYYANGEFIKAKEYLNKTTLAESWSDFAKNEYKLGNKEKGNYYTELGLKDHASNTPQEDVYEVIDNYIATFSLRKDGITKLNAMGLNSTGADYVAYLNCSEVAGTNIKEACFRTLYEKYPNGQFSADSLYNLFMIKYLQKKYYDAQRLGFLHLNKFSNVKSSPAIMYYMGKIAFKLKHYDNANGYYKKVIEMYPDSYYAFRANYNLYKDDGFFFFF